MLGFLLVYFYFPFASPFFFFFEVGFWVCKLAEAVMGLGWIVRMAVSSENVLRVVFGDWGMSAV
jgi:hypothetical protein